MKKWNWERGERSKHIEVLVKNKRKQVGWQIMGEDGEIGK